MSNSSSRLRRQYNEWQWCQSLIFTPTFFIRNFDDDGARNLGLVRWWPVAFIMSVSVHVPFLCTRTLSSGRNSCQTDRLCTGSLHMQSAHSRVSAFFLWYINRYGEDTGNNWEWRRQTLHSEPAHVHSRSLYILNSHMSHTWGAVCTYGCEWSRSI